MAAATSEALRIGALDVPCWTGTFDVGTPIAGSPWPRPAPPPPPLLPPPPARFACGFLALSSGEVSGEPAVPRRVTSTAAPTTAATAEAASNGDLWNSALTDSAMLTRGVAPRVQKRWPGRLERAG